MDLARSIDELKYLGTPVDRRCALGLAAAAALLLQLPLADGGFRGSFRAAAWAARSEARQLNTSGPSSASRRVGPVPDASQSWWLNGAPLQNVSGPLPADADIVIIGAGITVRQ
eukprot:COSAG06_NODE_37270_length_437_cov_0.807692_1_plen_113_part_01